MIEQLLLTVIVTLLIMILREVRNISMTTDKGGDDVDFS